MTAILLAFLVTCIAFAVIFLFAIQMKTDDESFREDAEFSVDMARRRGDRT